MDGTIDPERDYVEELTAALGRDWPTLAAARGSANEVRALLSRALTEHFGAFSSEDIDVIPRFSGSPRVDLW